MPHALRLLVATDFSQEAVFATQRAATLALAHGAELRLVHAHFVPSVAAFEKMGIRRNAARDLEAAARGQLAEVTAGLQAQGVMAEASFVKGGPLTAIERAAQTSGANLLVIGARGERSFRNVVLGSTSERLLGGGIVKEVLVVRNPVEGHYRRVLVCLDEDRGAPKMLANTAVWFPQARLRVVHAYEPLFEGKLRFAGASKAEVQAHRDECRKNAAQALAPIIAKSRVRLRRQDVVLQQGYAPDAILTAARRFKAELIVLGRRKTTISEMLLGSVSKLVLREAECDVAVLGL